MTNQVLEHKQNWYFLASLKIITKILLIVLVLFLLIIYGFNLWMRWGYHPNENIVSFLFGGIVDLFKATATAF